jgi:hypothetical protein
MCYTFFMIWNHMSRFCILNAANKGSKNVAKKQQKTQQTQKTGIKQSEVKKTQTPTTPQVIDKPKESSPKIVEKKQEITNNNGKEIEDKKKKQPTTRRTGRNGKRSFCFKSRRNGWTEYWRYHKLCLTN